MAEVAALIARIEEQAVALHEARRRIADLEAELARLCAEDDGRDASPAPSATDAANDLPWHYRQAVERERQSDET